MSNFHYPKWKLSSSWINSGSVICSLSLIITLHINIFHNFIFPVIFSLNNFQQTNSNKSDAGWFFLSGKEFSIQVSYEWILRRDQVANAWMPQDILTGFTKAVSNKKVSIYYFFLFLSIYLGCARQRVF